MNDIVRFSDVSVERVNGCLAFIRIDRGFPSNPVRGETMEQLGAVVSEAERDPAIRTIILGHAGKHFSAGAEFSYLEGLKTTPPETVRSQIYGNFQGTVRRIYQCTKPTVAAIGGAAVTVGCEIAIACDFRVVTEQASFHESWIKLGLMPPLGGAKMLPALVGFGMAADMVLRGRAVRGREALEIGLAHRLVSPEKLEAEAIILATELAAAPPLAYAGAKAALRDGLESDFEEVFANCVQMQSTLIASRDFREGVDAVVAKRAPKFIGA